MDSEKYDFTIWVYKCVIFASWYLVIIIAKFPRKNSKRLKNLMKKDKDKF